MIPAVGAHPPDIRRRLVVQPPEHVGGRPGVIHVGCRYQDREQSTHTVKDEVSLAAVDVFGVVPAALFAACGRIDGLTVNAGRCSRCVRLFGSADPIAPEVVDVVPGAVVRFRDDAARPQVSGRRSWTWSQVLLCRHSSKYRQTVLFGGKSLGKYRHWQPV